MKRWLLSLLSVFVPTDVLARKYPVSVKGVILINDKVILLKNVRNEWELPGGKLDPEESPEQCVQREIHEELGLTVSTGRIVDAWIYDIQGKVKVVIITYACDHDYLTDEDINISHEHKDVALFEKHELDHLNMPEGYKASIRK